MPVLLGEIKVLGVTAHWTPSGGAERSLGYTQEGWTINGTPHTIDIKVNELGETPVDEVANGYELTVEGALAVATQENTALAMNAAKTTVVGPPQKVSYDISPLAGGRLPKGQLRLHPMDKGDADLSEDWTFFKCSVGAGAQIVYRLNGQLYIPVRFKVLVDQDPVTGKVRLACNGDATTGVYFTLPGA